MIKLTKLRLINWHYFVNTTVNVENITFLTGANGTGKSTIIDALQIVLLGDTTGRNFNKAANDRNGRTLRGYLRGETGEDATGKVAVLRPGRFTSYIALEFYDTRKENSFTLGIVFDSYADGRDERHFFALDSAFPANNFTNKDLLDNKEPRPLTYRELAEFLSENYKSSQYRFFDTNEQYKQYLKVIFGNLPDKYFTLFKKSVSFVPISDISQFITEFVCDVDYNVDITPMQKNIEQYRLLQAESERIRQKIAALKAIKDAFDQYAKLNKDMGALSYVTARANLEYAKKELEGFKNKVVENQNRLAAIALELTQIDSQTKELSNEKEDYLAKKMSSSGFSLSSSLAAKKADYEQKIAALKLAAGNINKQVGQYCEGFATIANSVITALKGLDLDTLGLDERQKDTYADLLEFSAEIAKECQEIVAKAGQGQVEPSSLENLQKDMDSYRNRGAALYADCEQMVYKLSTAKNDLSLQIKSVSSGIKPFPSIYRQCLKELTDDLKARHPEAQVKVFCDLVDVNDPAWSNALEASLGNNRFNVFVTPQYYSEAYRILREIVGNYGFYGINIVDSERVISFVEDHPAHPDSLARLLTTKDEEARAYADYLLGTIKKCETFEEARDSGHGLLADCTGYRNFSTWYLRKPNNYFLGTRVDMGSAQGIHDQFQVLDRQVSVFTDLKDRLYPLTAVATMSAQEAKTYRDDLLNLNLIPQYEENVQRLSTQMHEGTLQDVAAIDDKIKAIDQDLLDLNSRKEQLTEEKGGCQLEIRRIQTEVLPGKEDVLRTNQQKLSAFDPKDVEDNFSKVYDELAKDMDTAQIVREANSRYVRYQNRQKAQHDQLLRLRSQYVTVYNLSYDVSDDTTNEVFDRELEGLQGVLLPQYEKKIAQAHDDAIKEFKDDFIFKLRSLIQTVESQIKELNDALADVRFGRDRYRFTVVPNKDYLEYYNMMMDPALLSAGDAEDVFLEKYKDLMDQLFGLISDSQDSTIQDKERILNNIEKFTDYRTYLNFDLLVKRGEGPNAVESSLARTFRRQSGGETQTPFYISILASFAQLYRVSQDADTLRLVIFDEAFSKMDAVRIKEAVGLLRSFGLQGLISTPAEKLRDLAKLVDEALVAIHDDKRQVSYLDLYEDTAKKILPIRADTIVAPKPDDGPAKTADASSSKPGQDPNGN